MSTATTKDAPATTGERDNTVRVRQMTDEEKTGEVPVTVGQATTPLVGIEAANAPAFKPSREMTMEAGSYNKNRASIAKHEAVLADDAAKPAAKKRAEREIESDRKYLHLHAEKLRAWGYVIENDGDDPVAPERMPSRADRYKQAAKVAAAKAPKKKSAERKPPRFADDLRNDVKFARYEFSGKNPGLKDGAHVPGASAGQHIKVRAHIDAALTEDGKPVTPANILKLTGYASFANLEKVARWEGTRGDLEPLLDLGQHFKGDSWAQGRYLAAIVATYIRRVKATADAAKKADAAAKKADKAAAKAATKTDTKTAAPEAVTA